MTGMVTKPRSSYLLSERTIRSALMNLYVSVMEAPENAKILLACDPSQVNEKVVHGNEVAKHCFLSLCRWLDNLKNFSFHGKIFEDQIMQPIKLAAGFVKDTKDQRLHTAKIRGFVFSKSMPYSDNVFGISRITISMIVPSIRNV